VSIQTDRKFSGFFSYIILFPTFSCHSRIPKEVQTIFSNSNTLDRYGDNTVTDTAMAGTSMDEAVEVRHAATILPPPLFDTNSLATALDQQSLASRFVENVTKN
jgi:hypothetical protein